MDNYLYYRNIFVVFVVFVVAVYLSVKYFKGVLIVNVDRAAPSFKNFVSLKAKPITTIFYIIFIVFCLFVLVSNIPLYKDFSNVLNKRYMLVKGYAVTQSISGKTNMETIGITVKDDKTGENVHVTFMSRYDIHKGDYLELYYYPQSRIGAYKDRSLNDRK